LGREPLTAHVTDGCLVSFTDRGKLFRVDQGYGTGPYGHLLPSQDAVWPGPYPRVGGFTPRSDPDRAARCQPGSRPFRIVPNDLVGYVPLRRTDQP
jgi:hypothetical protein